jgi:acetylornithine deacetylase/succinyl-diaminopimelate desuccinylase-like protein
MIVNDAVLAHLRLNRDRIFSKLVELASIPSVSTDPAHAAGIDSAARWVSADVAAAGPFAVRILPTAGNPVVYGERLGAPGKRTVLVYGHPRSRSTACGAVTRDPARRP